MLEIRLRKQFFPVLNRFIFVSFKFSYCDFSLVKVKPNLKALVEDDFSRVNKKPFKKNFVENLFVNKFQADVFEYPQLDTIEEVERLKKYSTIAQKLITDESNIDNSLCKVNSNKTVSTLKKFGLTGFKIPRLKNGFGFLSSEYSFMQEKLGIDPSLAKAVCENEDFGIQLIDSFGNDTQKEQYLRKLISGENISSFAHLELGNLISSGESRMNTSAILSSDKQNYIISGSKTWVYNGNSADVFILSANVKNSSEEQMTSSTLFLVNRNSPGIIVHEPIETVGMKNLNICDVTFNEVVVPHSCVLGNINEGDKIIKTTLSKGKFNIGGQCIAIMKKFVNKSIKHCLHNEFFNKDKYDLNYFRIKVGQMIAKIYVVESMTYLLTGRLDSFTDSEVFLESLIVKVFASEALQFVIKGTMEILGNEFFTSDESLSELMRDSQFFMSCDDTNDHLRLVLSSAGLKYAMSYRANPIEKFSKFLSLFRLQNLFSREEKLVHEYKLQGYLHLMFQKECWILEDSIDILHKCSQYLIKTYGKNVFHKYLELKILADVAINIYAMVATLGRASRAFCLGVKFHEVDRVSTETEIRTLALSNRKTRTFIKDLGAFSDYSKISSSVMNSKNYSHLYPVLRNLTTRNQSNSFSIKQ